jgi:hypothetical protein
MVLIVEGNAKQPNILSQMIAEAREIRDNQTYRNNCRSKGGKTNLNDDSVRSALIYTNYIPT